MYMPNLEKSENKLADRKLLLIVDRNNKNNSRKTDKLKTDKNY